MVVRDSATFSVTRIGNQLDLSEALYRPGWTRPLVSSRKMARRMRSVHHNWSIVKSDRPSP